MANPFPRPAHRLRSHDTPRGRPVVFAGDNAGDGQDLPVLDSSALDELEEELENDQLVTGFAADYAAAWEHRLARLTAAVEHQDRDTVLDVAISVKVSSAMIGGLHLAHLAEALETATRKGDVHEIEKLLPLIAASGSATVKEIERRYPRTHQ